MNNLYKAAQQALDFCEFLWREVAMNDYAEEKREAVEAALCAALEEPVQEPVAIVGTREGTWKGYEGQWLPPGPPIKTVHMLRDLPQGTPLYTSPPQCKPLTEEEIGHICAPLGFAQLSPIEVARAIEKAHRIGVEE